MNKLMGYTLSMLLCLACESYAVQTSHPHLLLNRDDVAQMVAGRDQYPVFKREYSALKSSMAVRMQEKIDVPVPRDAGGGYTHERHKRNYKSIHDAGILFQLTGEKHYAGFGKKILLAYADLYPTLGDHPQKKEQAPGKLFWQSLNEAVWLVYSIQGYDALASTLTSDEKQRIESQLLRPMAKFLSDESPQTFDKIHNHGTWAAAAVGMTGYTIGDAEMVEKALLGLDRSGNSGYLKQLDMLFSPDGYYTEGPYYQRYALMPFILFAKAIDYNDPQRKIFAYRNNILLKAVYSTIQLSYNKLFFPINDAIKDKGIDTTELVYGVDIVYSLTSDPALLSVAKTQGKIILSGDGLKVAKGLYENKQQPFPFKSMQFGDGANGDKGALDIFRSSARPGHQALLMKNTAQGMGHGHFDKLNWLFYDNGHEVVSDYGAARFLNVESKYGGHYLPENNSWAKQTIAHNTLVVDQKSQFAGSVKTAEQFHPTSLLFEVKEDIKISSASMTGAYKDVDFTRTMAMINDPSLEYPLVVDVLKVDSKRAHQYDLPLHYQGHIVNINFPIKANTKQLVPLGSDHGYQHLWAKASAKPAVELPQVTWLLANRFYTYSFLADKNSEVIFTELGANDANFNLRKESGIVQRNSKSAGHTYVSLLETHGEYNPSLEYTKNTYSQIVELKLVEEKGMDLVQLKTINGKQWILAISYNQDETKEHRVNVAGKTFEWTGFYHLFEN